MGANLNLTKNEALNGMLLAGKNPSEVMKEFDPLSGNPALYPPGVDGLPKNWNSTSESDSSDSSPTKSMASSSDSVGTDATDTASALSAGLASSIVSPPPYYRAD